MAVSGTINVNLSALDTYTADGVDSEKKVVLSSSDNLPSAVVAVASGTCGTTAVNVDFSQFRGADGELVDFGNIDALDETLRIAFSATPSARLKYASGNAGREMEIHSQGGRVSVSSLPNYPDLIYTITARTITPPATPAFTASYTVVMIKEA